MQNYKALLVIIGVMSLTSFAIMIAKNNPQIEQNIKCNDEADIKSIKWSI